MWLYRKTFSKKYLQNLTFNVVDSLQFHLLTSRHYNCNLRNKIAITSLSTVVKISQKISQHAHSFTLALFSFDKNYISYSKFLKIMFFFNLSMFWCDVKTPLKNYLWRCCKASSQLKLQAALFFRFMHRPILILFKKFSQNILTIFPRYLLSSSEMFDNLSRKMLAFSHSLI